VRRETPGLPKSSPGLLDGYSRRRALTAIQRLIEAAMYDQHRFHLEHAGHSFTVDVRSGRRREVELLVDGREVGYQQGKKSDQVTLAGELPEDPPQPFAIRVGEQRTHRSGPPACTLLLAGDELPVPDRTPVLRHDHRPR
jgi:hypothetical protein